MEASKEYLSQQKQEYQDKMAKEMAEFQKKLTDLKEKAAQAQGDLKVKLDNEVSDLQKKTDDLQKKLRIWGQPPARRGKI